MRWSQPQGDRSPRKLIASQRVEGMLTGVRENDAIGSRVAEAAEAPASHRQRETRMGRRRRSGSPCDATRFSHADHRSSRRSRSNRRLGVSGAAKRKRRLQCAQRIFDRTIIAAGAAMVPVFADAFEALGSAEQGGTRLDHRRLPPAGGPRPGQGVVQTIGGGEVPSGGTRLDSPLPSAHSRNSVHQPPWSCPPTSSGLWVGRRSWEWRT